MLTNEELLRRRNANVPRGVATAFPIYADRAENAELWDVEGRRFIDFASGIAVLNTGHRHPNVIKAVHRQCERLTHAAFQVTGYEPYVALAERINLLSPCSGRSKTVFLSTGAEAIENAVKIARAYTKRPGVIAFSGAFHGRSLLTLALTGKIAPYKQSFGPFPADVYHAPFPALHFGLTEEECRRALLNLMRVEADPERVAAVLIEPVQGEGGFNIAPPSFMKWLRELCDELGILLIVDEIQTGFARTGRMFAIEHYGVKPDLIAMAKGIAGGFPLAAVVGRADVMDAPQPGGLGGTFAGNPVSCAAGLAVLDVIADEGLLEKSSLIGRFMLERLETMRQRNDTLPIGNIRGLGAMVAFDVLQGRQSSRPDPAATKVLTEEALARGLVLLSCGVHQNTIRLLVPLTAALDLVHEGLDMLEHALIEVGTSFEIDKTTSN
jgi:4-aminobutyrate aminotransferase/(S)-3-amino-2-methylpropionate transaminase